MKTTVKHYTENELEELHRSGASIVMKEDYSNVFEPWKMSKVEQCANTLYTITVKCNGDSTEISDQIKKNNLTEFVEHHPKLYEKLTDLEFCKDPRAMKTLLQLFKIKHQQETGKLTKEQAQGAASMAALRVGLPENHPAQSSIEEND